MNHYSALYKYRKREKRSPLEDFLSEALRDLITRCLSTATSRSVFVRHLQSKFRESGNTLKNVVVAAMESAESGTLQLRTQVAIARNKSNTEFLDLLIVADGVPLIVVESKINAPLQPRQLERYSKWLVEERSSYGYTGSTAAVILLTANTDPPESFKTDSIERIGELSLERHTLRWWRVATFFQSLSRLLSDKDPTLSALCREFWEFAMTKEIVAPALDIEAIRSTYNHLREGNQKFGHLEKHFDIARRTIHEQLKQNMNAREKVKFSELNNSKTKRFELNDESPLIWEWVYLPAKVFNRCDIPESWYIAWGFEIIDKKGQGAWQEEPGRLRSTRTDVGSTVNLVFIIAADDSNVVPLETRKHGSKAVLKELQNTWTFKRWIGSEKLDTIVSSSPLNLDGIEDSAVILHEKLRGWACARIPDAVSIVRMFGPKMKEELSRA